MSDHTELDAAIAAVGLEYSARFVPQSQSRNAKETQPSLNWVVTLKRGSQVLTTDYMQGIGHLPHAPGGRKAFARYERKVAEEGKTARFTKPLQAPLLRDVLYCLVMDVSVLDSAGFEDWASEYGYDTDSRRAEQIYRTCIEQSLQLRALIGEQGLTKLREAFQDY